MNHGFWYVLVSCSRGLGLRHRIPWICEFCFCTLCYWTSVYLAFSIWFKRLVHFNYSPWNVKMLTAVQVRFAFFRPRWCHFQICCHCKITAYDAPHAISLLQALFLAGNHKRHSVSRWRNVGASVHSVLVEDSGIASIAQLRGGGGRGTRWGKVV